MNGNCSYRVCLKVISAIMVSLAAVAAIMGLSLVVLGIVSGPEATIAATTLGQNEETQAVDIIIGIFVFITAVIDMLIGLLGLRVADNRTEMVAFFGLSIIGLFVAGIATIATLTMGVSLSWVSQLFTLVAIAFCIWLATHVRPHMGIGNAEYQASLRIVSYLQIIFSILVVSMGIAFLAGGGFLQSVDAYMSQGLWGDTLSFDIVVGVVYIVLGIVYMLVGILGLLGSKDERKLGAFYALSIAAFAGAVVGSIISLAQVSNLDWLIQVVAVIMATTCIWLARKIKMS